MPTETPSKPQVIVGTSGYSFTDWVGPFYPPGTRRGDMLAHYVQHFPAVEVNYTYYRMPTARTLAALARNSPPEFLFWVKANQETTHKRNRQVAGEFLDALAPLTEAGKLAGVLLQFPQSFHRTIANRKYLAAALADLSGPPLAVEFRHCSWADPGVAEGLRRRQAILVVPDAPPIPALYHVAPTATTPVGYLRLHSRNAEKWYAGAAERYDYSYSAAELQRFATDWTDPALGIERLFAFFNNCHQSQAAANAQAFQRILAGMG